MPSRKLSKVMSAKQIKKIAKTVGVNMRKSLQRSKPLTKALRKSMRKSGMSPKMTTQLSQKVMKDWRKAITSNKGVRNFFAKHIAAERLKSPH